MRTLLRVSIPVESGNRSVKDGSLESTIQRTMDSLRPEAAYFFPDNGRRSCIMVFDLKSPSDIPTIAERFFTELDATVDLVPVMNVEDLKKGLSSMMEHSGAVRR